MVRRTGIEPVYSAWRADILAIELPALKIWRSDRDSNAEIPLTGSED